MCSSDLKRAEAFNGVVKNSVSVIFSDSFRVGIALDLKGPYADTHGAVKVEIGRASCRERV